MTKANTPEARTMPIAESGNQGGIRMWPSPEWASKLSDWANIGLIASLIFGVLSTVLLVWMGNVKEEYLKRDLATANGRAAEAIQKAEEEHLARVRIEEKLAGWKLDAAGQARVIQRIAPYRNTPFDLGANPSEVLFMEVVDGLLGAAGWTRQIPKSDNPLFNLLLNNKARINYVSGVYVEFAQSRDKDFRPAAAALVEALRAEGIPAQGQISPAEKDTSAIHVVIGSR